MGLPSKPRCGTESSTLPTDTWKNWNGLGFDDIVIRKTISRGNQVGHFRRRTKREREQKSNLVNQSGTKVKRKGRRAVVSEGEGSPREEA